MTGVIQADTAQLPPTSKLSHDAIPVEVTGTRAKGQRIDNVGSKIVANVENTGALVTSEAVHVLGRVGFATADRAVVDGMRISVAGLEREAIAQVAFEGDSKSVIKAGSDVALVVHRAIRISLGEILIQWAHAICSGSVQRDRSRAEIDPAARKQTNAVAAEVRSGQEEVPGKLMFDSPAPFHSIKIAAVF